MTSGESVCSRIPAGRHNRAQAVVCPVVGYVPHMHSLAKHYFPACTITQVVGKDAKGRHHRVDAPDFTLRSQGLTLLLVMLLANAVLRLARSALPLESSKAGAVCRQF